MTPRNLCAALLLACLSCAKKDEPKPADGVGEPSPNASIMPAPLAAGTELELRPKRDMQSGAADAAERLLFTDAGEGPPRPFREDEVLPRDELSVRDGSGVTLQARWRWPDVPAPAGGPDVDLDAIKEARQKADFDVNIDLAAAGRMRMTLAAASFPLAYNTEFRSRRDRLGHVLVWPNGNAYRILPQGSLRALFAERRTDVAPLVDAKLRESGSGTLLGVPTRKTELSTQLGQVTLEQGNVPGVGPSGALLCRMLLEFIAAAPSSAACSEQWTPLRAEFRWPERGRIVFEVASLAKRAELPLGQLYVPPLGALFKPGELPPESSGVFLKRQELARFRTRDAPLVLATDERTPGEGVMAVNRTDALHYLTVDGVPAAWVRPHSEKYVIGLKPGRYAISWRDFLGTEPELRKTIDVPARIVVGREEGP
ncbi:MAG TPA: hypothetical protein VK509_05265 [Polyangiales bacterium]|nr:hypothetical protein [Polyangiales bacterium]